MKVYETLNRARIAIDALEEPERRAFERIYRRACEGKEWSRFANYMWRVVSNCYASAKMKRDEIVRSPLYQIAEDLEARLAISEGKAAEPDYRVDLERLIHQSGTSRYRLSKKTRVSQALLSRVVSKRKNLSIENLCNVLDALDYRLAFIPKIEARDIASAVFEVHDRNGGRRRRTKHRLARRRLVHN